MTYKAVRITELMAHEFAQVEGALDSLDKKALKAAIPANFSVDQFIEQVEQGHWLLLNDSPVTPMLIKESNEMGNAAWVINNQTIDRLEPAAQKALLARTDMTGAVSGATQSRNLHPPLPMAPYIPEPPKPSDSDKPLPLKYEYCFEIACSDESFRHRVCCSFVLAKTKNEAMLGRWTESKTEHGTRYTVLTAVDEPKRLVAEIASYPMGISLEEPVKVKPIGTQTAYEGFIPVCPAVQLGERLGLPTEGYFYHFHDGKLIQEYKLLGDKKWSFYGTRSTSDRLDDTQAYNMYQNALLVYWKIGGKIVENQYLVYLEQQITRDVLDNLNDEWLSQHGVKLTIPALLEAAKQPVIAREDKSQTEEPQENRASYGLPPAAPDAFNHPLNAFYDYSERFLVDTNVKAINVNHSLVPDIPLVNLKTISESATEFDLGFTQVEQTQDLDTYWETLFSSETSEQHRAVIKKYNTHLNDPVRQGEIVILLTMEPKNASQQEKLDALIEEAQAASIELSKLTYEQNQLHYKYFEVLENKFVEYWNSGKPSDEFAYMGSTIGTIAPAMQKNLENVSSSLQRMDRLYLDLLSKKVDRASFIRQRQGLKKILDKQLDKITQRTLKIPVDQSLKASLGINSTKSIIHNADEILKAGTVPGLGKRVANTAKWISYAEKAGKVAIGFSVVSSVFNVSQNCESLESCARNSVKETGGIIGGWAGGTAGAAATGAFVAFIGVTYAPIVMLAVGSGALGLGIFGNASGKDIAEKAYEFFELDLFFEKIENNIERGIPDDIEEYINKQLFNDFNIGSIF
ncbi:LysM peptidoglycan-binding domain-containing protein [Vibrio metschnikovii]|uniref:LysM peptidoglycan-binding domain-containing protein n=1 Tax=Vibrio metschnikovii TaxID=28172 RepID=UPI002FCB2D4D